MSSNILENIEGYEFSDNQKNLWLIGNEAPETFYNQVVLELDKELDSDQLITAIQTVIQKHEVLTFRMNRDSKYLYPLQYTGAQSKVEYNEVILKENEKDVLIDSTLNYSYDPSENEPLRFCFVKDGSKITSIVIRLYAFWADVYSSIFFCKELSKAITNLETYQKEELEKVVYTSYAAWQNELVNEPEEEALRFWNSYNYQIEEKVIPFSNDLSLNFQPIKKQLSLIEGDEYLELKKYCTTNNVEISDVLLSRFSDYVSQFTQNEVTLGYIPYKRDYEELENTFGYVAKTIPLKINQNKGETILENSNTLKRQIDQVKDWVDYFSLHRGDTVNNNNSKFNYCFEFIDDLEVKNLQIKDITSIQDTFDVKVSCINYGDKISIQVYVDQNKFNLNDIDVISTQLNIHFREINSGSTSKGVVSDLEQRIISKSNDTQKTLGQANSIVELFEDQVKTSSDATALITETKNTNYNELNIKANQLKNYLIHECNVAKGDAVCIVSSHSESFVVSMLGVLKAGAFYIPVDRDNPKDRIEFILKESQSKVIICDEDIANDYTFPAVQTVIPSDEQLYNHTLEDVNVVIANTDLAYCIYTSGSTGNPKGCTINHQNVLNYIQWSNAFYFGDTDSGNWGLITSISFDLTVTSIFTSLTRGKKLWIGNHKMDINELLKEALTNKDVDTLKLTPSHLSLIQELNIEKTNVKTVICGGEQLTKKQMNGLWNINKDILIYNEYGPTETTVGCIVKKMNQDQSRVTIGTPVANTTISIITPEGEPCPIGVAGELLIGGSQVSTGYLNRPDLTKDRFVTDQDGGNKLYKTGDLARWLPDGDIEYIGRRDNQLKIRGYRIELGEIEQHLQSVEDISSAVVLVKEDEEENKELVAFVKANTKIETDKLRESLSKSLPQYMIPTSFLQIEKLPLTVNGKVDSKALLEMATLALDSRVAYEAPKNETEEQLVSIWEEILQKKDFGANDDFFALGGHSIKATRLINEYQKTFSVKLTLKEVFENPTLRSHANLLLSTEKSKSIEIQKVEKAKNYPLSSSQLRLWVLSQFKDASVAYNIPNSIVLSGDYDMSIFTESINLVIDRHEILRTIFKENSQGEVRQWVLTREELGFAVNYEDLREEGDIKKAVQDYIKNDSYKAFNLSEGPLLRASLLQVSNDDYVFYYNMHHIISDGWSMEVLTKDILTYYNAYEIGKSPNLPELKIQYKDYASWEQSQLNSDNFNIHKQYWLDQLSGNLPAINLPSKKVRPKVKTHNGNRLYTYLSKELTTKIKEFSQENGGSVFMTLLSTWNVLFQKYTSSKDIILGTPVAGRNLGDLENQIGFYINSLVLRNNVHPESSFLKHYDEVKKSTLTAFSHQVYPFDRLVEELELIRDTSRNPVFDVMLILQNNGEIEENANPQDDVINKIVDQGSYMSKFDMSINYKEVGEYLYFDITYNKDLYDKETIERLMKHYMQLTTTILSRVLDPISEVTYLSNKEEDILLTEYNTTKVDFPENGTLVNLFQDQVLKTPDHTALVFGDKRMSYQELDSVSNQFANYIKSTYNIGVGDLISLTLDRSEWNVITMIGILKAGAAYIPIDPEYPQDRISYIKSDSQSKLTVDEILLEEFWEKQSSYTTDDTETAPNVNDLAYVIYTSGSTGKPKGVMIEHGNIVNTILSQIKIFDLRESDHSLQFASFSFDASVSEIFITLLSGASLFIADDKMRSDPTLLESYIIDQKISIATLPPSYLRLMDVKNLKGMRGLITAGEAPAIDKVSEYLSYGTFYNAYGPTETSICGSVYKIPKGSSLNTTTIPIGYPIANTQIYILDEFNNLQPDGVVGEICIGGKGLAREYLNKPELTDEKFIENPFGSGKLYKTGDLGTWLPDGSVEFLGRLDDQIKINGYRVELNEIEVSLENHEDIEEALVLIKENQNSAKELVAYLKKKQKVCLTPSLSEYLVYDDLLYRALTSDEKRNNVYKKVFQKLLKGKVVLDVGTGKDAILSRFCIEAGAKKVYAVEILEESYNKAKNKIQSLKLDDKIILVHGDITQIDLPEKVDYCISEIVGSIGGSEGASKLINDARRLLKDSKNMIPERSLTKIAGVHFPENSHEFLFDKVSNHYVEKIFDQVGYNFDFRVCVENFPINNIITNEEAFEDLDFRENIPLETTHTIRLNFNKKSSISGFLVWLYLYVDQENVIDSLESKYVWKPVYLPVFDNEVDVQVGDYIEMTIDRQLSENMINPDFLISGTLVTKDEEISFDYKTGNHSNTYKGNTFYEKIFQDEKLKTQNSFNTTDLRNHLQEVLPEYMIPSHYVEVDNFPITVNGKIDKKALPDPYSSGLHSGIEYVAPDNEIEEKLAIIWQKYLNREKIGVNDDFFHVGGDSIKGVRIMSEIQKVFNVKIDIETLFHNTTVRAVAEEIANQTWLLRETKKEDVVDKILI